MELPKHVKEDHSRHGKPRYRFRRRVGGILVQKVMPDPGTETQAFWNTYADLMKRTGAAESEKRAAPQPQGHC